MALCMEGALRAPVINWMISRCMEPVFEAVANIDMLGVRWLPRTGRSVPDIEYVDAVELKLEELSGVLRQAVNNCYRAHRSWCAMPHARIARMKDASIQKFRDAGVGLLSCARYGCTPVVDARTNYDYTPSPRTRRILWRRRSEWRFRKGVGACSHCGVWFPLEHGIFVPTHDFPVPCRSICLGSMAIPKTWVR